MKNERAEWMWRISDEDIYLLLAKILLCVFVFVLIYVTGSGKRDIFAHIFKIELLVPQGRVNSQL